MKLGLNLGYWGGRDAGSRAAATFGAHEVELARRAEDLGYDVVWAAEAYGSDAVSVLSWVAAKTATIDVGSAVMQLPARSPAMTAMTAATLDSLSGGRFRLGLGVSGPQVSEGWHGVRFDKPLARTAEYVEIVRKALARQVVTHEGEHWTLPLPDGPGKALRMTIGPATSGPRRGEAGIPLYLAAVGPKNLELTGRIADGWLGVFFSPDHAQESLDRLRQGRRDAGHDGPDPLQGFDVVPTVPVVVDDDLDRAHAPVRAYTALYVGGMGSRRSNFYHRQAVRMGFGEAAAAVQDAYLAGNPRDAAALVPPSLIEATAIVGPARDLPDKLGRWAGAGVTTLSVALPGGDHQNRLRTLEQVARAAGQAGLR